MSLLLERLEKDGMVQLERYGHQVGGRQLFLKYDNCLCKPLIPRERFFYETATKSLRRYMPDYFGVINVNYVQQPSGEIQVVASLKDRQQPVANHSDKCLPKCTNGHSNGVSVTSTKIVNTAEYFTPWARMCSENLDKGLKQMQGNLQDFKKDYVILENLTAKYEAPSVLDLKVGINWPGSTHSPLKPEFGVRMAGMQKFDHHLNQYTFHDKYFGKQFSESEFRQVLRSFLDNGVSFRSDLLPTILKMLKDLQASIQRSPSFRFFSSSLLLIYDGAVCYKPFRRMHRTCQRREKVGRRVKRKHCAVDGTQEGLEHTAPANCNGEGNYSFNTSKRIKLALREPSLTCASSASPTSNATPTSTLTHTPEDSRVAVATGLTSDTITGTQDTNPLDRISSTKPLQHDHPKHEHLETCLKCEVCSCSGGEEGVGDNGKPRDLEQFPKTPPHLSETAPSLMSASELAGHRKNVDLRMIDFARSTHADHYDQVCYEGLDECYLTGLSSLAKIFQEMIDEKYP